MRYSVDLHDAELAEYIADDIEARGNGVRLEADDTRVKFGDLGLAWFRDHLSEDDDGHVESRTMWVGGIAYPVVEEE